MFINLSRYSRYKLIKTGCLSLKEENRLELISKPKYSPYLFDFPEEIRSDLYSLFHILNRVGIYSR